MAGNKTTAVKVGSLSGFTGIGIAMTLILVSICGIDENVPEIIASTYDVALRWLWPASVLLPDYIVGSLDRSFLLARVVAAVFMNGILIPAIGIGLVLNRHGFRHPKCKAQVRGRARLGFW
jgi:hypothetical protein